MKIILIGAGRYGKIYLDYILENQSPEIELAGIVEKNFDSSPAKEEAEAAQIPVYQSLEEYYSKNTAELAVIVTPPFLHCEQSVYCLKHGSNVLCEKPAAPTVAEVEQMIDAEKKYGKFIAIGYQWSYSDAILNLKKDILDGEFGKPLRMKTMTSWWRDRSYYTESSWGGRISKDGRLIYDSIASNACAHDIHNMLFLLGDTMNSSAFPEKIEAECFRANDIESFDTCVLRMTMKDGVHLYFSASHAAYNWSGPEFIYEFEDATVDFSADEGFGIVAHFKDGRKKSYGDPFADGVVKKLEDCIAAARNGEVPVCTAETAVCHTRLIGEIFKNVNIIDFPERTKVLLDNRIYVDGLYEALRKAYESESMLSENMYLGA